jgi:hypothetical protein
MCWKNKEVGGLKKVVVRRLEMVSNSCLECEVLLDAICPFNMNSITMELIIMYLKNRNGHRREKT